MAGEVQTSCAELEVLSTLFIYTPYITIQNIPSGTLPANTSKNNHLCPTWPTCTGLCMDFVPSFFHPVLCQYYPIELFPCSYLCHIYIYITIYFLFAERPGYISFGAVSCCEHPLTTQREHALVSLGSVPRRRLACYTCCCASVTLQMFPSMASTLMCESRGLHSFTAAWVGYVGAGHRGFIFQLSSGQWCQVLYVCWSVWCSFGKYSYWNVYFFLDLLVF